MNLNVFLIVLLLANTAFAQTINVTDVNGKKQGPWQKQYPKSRAFIYKGQFKDDKPVGTFTFYYPSTKVKAVVQHDIKTGRSAAKMYHENGILQAKGIYRNQLKDSVWDYYGPSGRLSTKESYSKDKLNGKQIIYYVPEDPENKNVLPAKVSIYVNGVLDGDVIEYFDSGVVKSKTTYVKGIRDGIAVINHPNGKPSVQERWKKGVQHGWQSAHDETGKEIGKKYYYYGDKLEGKQLEEKLKQLKAKGISPNG